MLLNEMEITNFRQFIGTQKIVFSEDIEKNITFLLGASGTGKTTLAQAFSWCLYGRTDFDDPILINKKVTQEMTPTDEEAVKVVLSFSHNNKRYSFIREQKFVISNSGDVRTKGYHSLNIAFTDESGNRKFIEPKRIDFEARQILPEELSKFFFFDGERIGNMSKEIRKGRSKEFADAVKGILGLDAMDSAIDHLKNSKNKASVLKAYEKLYDSSSNQRIQDLSLEISDLEAKITEIDVNVEENRKKIAKSKDHIALLEGQISENKATEVVAEKISELKNINEIARSEFISSAKRLSTKASNSTHDFLLSCVSKKLDEMVSSSDGIDLGIPDIHERTVEYILEKERCICGTTVTAGSKEASRLQELKKFIPPRSLATLSNEFLLTIKKAGVAGVDSYNDIEYFIEQINQSIQTIEENEDEISRSEEQIKGADDVGNLQIKVDRIREDIDDLTNENERLIENRGGLKKEEANLKKDRSKIVLDDKNNRKIEIYIEYTKAVYEKLRMLYKTEEEKIREALVVGINQIFKTIYAGGLSIRLDENYKIQVIVEEHGQVHEDIETSTAQSMSVIFAFIAGVIQLARENRNNDMLTSEAYPLVMDAPLSAFDKERIKAFSTSLPNIAEQIVIFIKDTDGELASESMGNRIGKYYQIIKESEIISKIVEVDYAVV
jgi:DNA sulfur modification protein DndD